jgi:hypothetical protein
MKTLIYIFLLLPLISLGQGISINVSQDARLALVGDKRGNGSFTTNVNLAAEFRGWQKGNSYFLTQSLCNVWIYPISFWCTQGKLV